MNHIFAAASEQEFHQYRSYAENVQERLYIYLKYLFNTYFVTDLPKSIVWTSVETATNLISDIPVPAYTNEHRTVFCPDLESWRGIYLKQLDDLETEEVRRYYETQLTQNHILQILGHEFVHHSELLIDEAYETTMWFEEGICEYISRRFFLTDAEFAEEARINRILSTVYQEKFGTTSLSDFCFSTYSKSYAGIFHLYWRSFLAVQEIMEQFGGDVLAVFREYHRWYDANTDISLWDWFCK